MLARAVCPWVHAPAFENSRVSSDRDPLVSIGIVLFLSISLDLDPKGRPMQFSRFFYQSVLH